VGADLRETLIRETEREREREREREGGGGGMGGINASCVTGTRESAELSALSEVSS